MQINLVSMRKYLAEFIGTFFLVLIVSSSITNSFAIPTPTLAALMLGIFVYTIGSISGCHLNPAVTLGLMSLKKIKFKEALNYVLAQLLGASLALFVARVFEASPELVISDNTSVYYAELLGMVIFTFGISAVVLGQIDSKLNGIIVGTSLFLGLAVASTLGSAALLNPAVMLGLAISSPSYFMAELMGSVIGFNLYKILLSEEKKPKQKESK